MPEQTTCIRQLLQAGAEKDHVLMIRCLGIRAAEDNGVLYYPILVKKKRVWEQFLSEGWKNSIGNLCMQEYIKKKVIEEFQKNLPNKQSFKMKSMLLCAVSMVSG